MIVERRLARLPSGKSVSGVWRIYSARAGAPALQHPVNERLKSQTDRRFKGGKGQ